MELEVALAAEPAIRVGGERGDVDLAHQRQPVVREARWRCEAGGRELRRRATPAGTASAIQRLRVTSPSRTACQGVARIRLPAAPTARAHSVGVEAPDARGGPRRTEHAPVAVGVPARVATQGATEPRRELVAAGDRGRAAARPSPAPVVRPAPRPSPRRRRGRPGGRRRTCCPRRAPATRRPPPGTTRCRSVRPTVGAEQRVRPGRGSAAATSATSSGVRIPASATPTRSSRASSSRSRADRQVGVRQRVQPRPELGDGGSEVFR